jgi:hypothetical protein
MRLNLIIHVKRYQNKNMTCHRNPSPTHRRAPSVFYERLTSDFGRVLAEQARCKWPTFPQAQHSGLRLTRASGGLV